LTTDLCTTFATRSSKADSALSTLTKQTLFATRSPTLSTPSARLSLPSTSSTPSSAPERVSYIPLRLHRRPSLTLPPNSPLRFRRIKQLLPCSLPASYCPTLHLRLFLPVVHFALPRLLLTFRPHLTLRAVCLLANESESIASYTMRIRRFRLRCSCSATAFQREQVARLGTRGDKQSC